MRSTTMITVLMLAMAVRAPLLSAGIFALAGAGALLAEFENLQYFIDRIPFLGPETENLSRLVWIQGWENAGLSIWNSFGFGGGFQQFGIATARGDAANALEILGVGGLNALDGGTTGSKIVGELGLFGLFALAWHGWLSLRLARSAYWRQNTCDGPHFLVACVIGYVVELYVRGFGYFTPGGVLCLAGLFLVGRRPSAPAVSGLRAAASLLNQAGSSANFKKTGVARQSANLVNSTVQDI